MARQTTVGSVRRDGSGHGTADSRAAAAYVAEISGSLAAIARENGFDALGFLLEMAQVEAQNNAGPGPSG